MSLRAKYPGRCPECGNDIEVNDLLDYDADDRVVHAACVEGAVERTELSREVCPRCFLEKAANGACGCDPEDGEAGDAA